MNTHKFNAIWGCIIVIGLLMLIAVVLPSHPVSAQNATNGFGYTRIITATNTQVATIGQTLHTVVINGGATGAVTLYDNASSCATTVIGVIQAATAPVTLTYDLQLKNGLCITTAAATDVTVTTR